MASPVRLVNNLSWAFLLRLPSLGNQWETIGKEECLATAWPWQFVDQSDRTGHVQLFISLRTTCKWHLSTGSYCLLWPGTWHGVTKFGCGNAQSTINSISCVQSHVYFTAWREVWLSVFKRISKDKHLLWASWILTKYKLYSCNQIIDIVLVLLQQRSVGNWQR